MTQPSPAPIERTRWSITVYACGDGPPAEVRLKRVLKHLWRTHGLRCTAITRVDRQAASDQVTREAGR